jgi:hypothetical protein
MSQPCTAVANPSDVSVPGPETKGGFFVSKHDLIWVAIRVIGIYMLVQAASMLPFVLGIGTGDGYGRIGWAVNAAIGVYLTCWGGALHRLACTERRAP